MGTWPRSKRLRTIGKLEQIMILEGGFEAYMLRGYTQVLGGRAEDLQIVLALAKREVRDPAVHTPFWERWDKLPHCRSQPHPE
ncbi:hypothetical protein P3342_011094 [Pyrenophora teres f. teres]|nr:hypothetical protein P3342_011094 [Pyrenophora teres f. teres]